eukprot:jgi/Tetstr1/423319/TSEL_014017.t1
MRLTVITLWMSRGPTGMAAGAAALLLLLLLGLHPSAGQTPFGPTDSLECTFEEGFLEFEWSSDGEIARCVGTGGEQLPDKPSLLCSEYVEVERAASPPSLTAYCPEGGNGGTPAPTPDPFPNHPPTRSVSEFTCAELNFDELSGTDQVCAASTWSSSVSSNPSCRRGTFEWARRVCEDRAGGRGGARLCTLAELVAGEGDASTCTANNIAIWTRTPCNVDGGGQGFMAALPLDGASPTCTPLEDTDTRVRCCADASTEQAPAPTPTPAPTPDPFPNHPPTRSVSEFTCAELNFDELSGTDQVCAASTWSSSVSSNPSCRRGTFEWARRVCEDRAGGRGGARLCTLAELVAGEGDASTCAANDIAIWTRTPCNVDGGGQGFMAALPLDGASPTCTPLEDTDTRVRCCADASTEQEPAPPLTPAPTPDPFPNHPPTRSVSEFTCAELNFDELSGTDQVCAASTWSSSVSSNPSCRRGTFEWARRVCEDRAGGRGGARLCTLAELVAGEGDASTCAANNIAIWTRTPCNVDGGGQGFMAALPLDGASPTCTPLDDIDTRVRCCADANN